MGCTVSAVTSVGEDYPVEYLRQLERLGVKSLAVFRSGRSTAFSSLWIGRERKLRLIAPGPTIPADIVANLSADAVLFSPVAGEISLKHVNAYRGVKCLDLQGFVRRAASNDAITLTRLPEPIILNALVVHASAEEVTAALGIRDMCAAVKKLTRLGVENVIAGLEEGILTVSKNEGGFFTPFRVEGIMDGTGAGDILTGAFIASLLKGRGIVEATAESVALLNQSLSNPPPYRVQNPPEKNLVEKIIKTIIKLD